MLAFYWPLPQWLRPSLAAAALLPRVVKHARLLFGSGLAAMFGCFLLFFTNNWMGAFLSLIFLGAGLRQHLSAHRGSHRPPLSLLPSRLLERHLFGGAAWRFARARLARLCRHRRRNRRPDRPPLVGTIVVTASVIVDLVGGKDQRPMTKPALHSALLAAAAALAAQGAHAPTLAERIQKLIDNSPSARTAFWGIQVTDLATGKALVNINADKFFVPASNTKLFTTALALTRLGPDYKFQTRRPRRRCARRPGPRRGRPPPRRRRRRQPFSPRDPLHPDPLHRRPPHRHRRPRLADRAARRQPHRWRCRGRRRLVRLGTLWR